MNVGDLLGSGTISGPDKHERGSLLEISWNGTEPIELPGGEKRTFLEDGDLLAMRGWCQGDGYRVGFGEVEGTITPAVYCHCERSEAIQAGLRLDCFVASAPRMTGSSSTILRRNIPDARRMRRDVFKAVGQMHALVRRWTLIDPQSRPPFLRGPDRPRHKTAAAVRAHIVQFVLDAVRAERALIAADARFRRMRRKILVAVFAVRPELQRHGFRWTRQRAMMDPRFRQIRHSGCASGAARIRMHELYSLAFRPNDG